MQLNGSILILGDSFCQHVNGWPAILCDKFNYHNKVVDGVGGASWWSIRYRMLHNVNNGFLSQVKLLIFIHTQRDRLFSRNTSVLVPPLDSSSEICRSIELYYKYIHDSEYCAWAEKQWQKELTHYVKDIPHVIHLFFDRDHATDLFGHCVPTGLLDLALAQYNRGHHNNLINDGLKGYLNHFTPENNQIFADQLYQIITGAILDFDITKFKREQ